MSFFKFPSIEQFRNVVKSVRERSAYVGQDENGDTIKDFNKQQPTLSFRGTVKVHGTNAAIVRMPDGRFLAQSRNNTLVAPGDNAGFRAFVESIPNDQLERMFAGIANGRSVDDLVDMTQPVVVYGEWAGKGIQSGVAVSGVDRFFYLFAVRNGDKFLDARILNDIELPEKLYVSSEFGAWSLEVDFNDPVNVGEASVYLAQETAKVEEVCPVGNFFGVSGVGEGIVWNCTTPGYEDLLFKVKGEKHSVSKVHTLAPANVEKVKSVQEFVEKTVTPQRLEQGLSVMKEKGLEVDIKNMGEFIRWVSGDVNKEEADTMEASGLTMKDIGKALGDVARRFYLGRLV